MINSQTDMDKYIKLNKHFILYCKGWYKSQSSNNSINDLIKILEDYCGTTGITINDLYLKMIEIFQNIVEKHEQENFLNRLFEYKYLDNVGDPNVISKECIILALKSKIGLTKVMDRYDNLKINLGMPDHKKYSFEFFKDKII